MAIEKQFDATQKPAALTLLRSEIVRFLKSDQAEALCIRGKWGVGKTFTWETCLKDSFTAGAVKGEKYSYVSLFGLDSIDRLKSSIFENTIPIAKVGSDPTIETLDLNIKSVSTNLLKAWKPNIASAADQISFLAVRNLIVCVDDLERKGDKLRIIDVLGLASLLKERRKCKVVIILNELELDDKDKTAFDQYNEKVIDSSLVFEPTADESSDIALKDPSAHQRALAEKCIALGISNIRILKKLERLVRIVEPHLRDFDPRVLAQAISTIALFGWCVYGHQEKLLEFALTQRYRSRYGLNDGKLSEDDAKFDALLETYGFALTDAFDRVILNGITTGFFDPVGLLSEAKGLDATYKDEKTKELLDKPWTEYRDSFDDNGDKVVLMLQDVFESHMPAVQISYLDAGVRIFKRLGKPELATAAIKRFFDSNPHFTKSDLDLNNTPVGPTDPELIEAIQARYNAFQDNREPVAVLFEISKRNGWNPEDITLLTTLTEDDFYKMFKSLRGIELRLTVRRALEFGKQSMAAGDADYKKIGDNALAALKRLGAESEINAERIQGLYNVR